jgi:FkbM family methyltransferase
MKKEQNIIVKYIYRLARKIELGAAYIQGKGYGAATIKHEYAMVNKLMGGRPILAIDIGGNIGDYTAEIRKKNSNVEIHIFEPSVTNIEKLNFRFKGDDKIYIVPYAVSNKIGIATLFANISGSGLGSMTKRNLDHFDIEFNVKEEINTIRFEEYWLNKLESRRIDLVKLDIEGHELFALEGFGKAISEIKIIQFEFGGCNIDTKTYFQDFWYFFKERNFELYRITRFGVEEIKSYKESDEFFSTTNYIAVNREVI